MEDWEGEVVEMKGWLRLALVNLCMDSIERSCMKFVSVKAWRVLVK